MMKRGRDDSLKVVFFGGGVYFCSFRVLELQREGLCSLDLTFI